MSLVPLSAMLVFRCIAEHTWPEPGYVCEWLAAQHTPIEPLVSLYQKARYLPKPAWTAKVRGDLHSIAESWRIPLAKSIVLTAPGQAWRRPTRQWLSRILSRLRPTFPPWARAIAAATRIVSSPPPTWNRKLVNVQRVIASLDVPPLLEQLDGLAKHVPGEDLLRIPFDSTLRASSKRTWKPSSHLHNNGSDPPVPLTRCPGTFVALSAQMMFKEILWPHRK